MKVTTSTTGESQEDKIQAILQSLRTQIDRYNLVDEDARSKGDLLRSERIEQLMLEERRLSEANQTIRKQLKHYEKMYEKALKKKVKALKMHLEDGQQKLEVMKQRYQRLDANSYKMGRPKKTGKLSKVSKSAIKVRTMVPKQFRQTTLPIAKQIKTKIGRNEELGNRKLHVVNESNSTANTSTDLVNTVQPTTVNARECRIMLQRLTKEQIELYKNQKQPDQSPKKRRRQSPQKVNENRLSIIKPKWHIKIPKSVLDESQKEIEDASLDPVIDSSDTV